MSPDDTESRSTLPNLSEFTQKSPCTVNNQEPNIINDVIVLTS